MHHLNRSRDYRMRSNLRSSMGLSAKSFVTETDAMKSSIFSPVISFFRSLHPTSKDNESFCSLYTLVNSEVIDICSEIKSVSLNSIDNVEGKSKNS